jgi:hypothetical protein
MHNLKIDILISRPERPHTAQRPLEQESWRGKWRGKDGEEEKYVFEWAILRDTSIKEYNFESKWCGECEKTWEALAKVPDFGNNDF